MKKINRGFTFIELMTVIAIIAILTAIVLPNLNNARIKGRDAKRISDIKSIQLALVVFYDTNRTTGYPTNVTDLYTADSNGPTVPNYIFPTYVPNVPKDPKSGLKYAYTKDGSGNYCLGAHLEGTVPPNEDSPCTLANNSGVWDDSINYTVQN